MRKSRFYIILCLCAGVCMGGLDSMNVSPCAAQTPKGGLVNVFIGTNGMGHTFPGACFPYGFVQLSPDTDTIPHNINGVYQPRVYDYCAGYQHRDSSIVGFSHTHFSGTGHRDLGEILIMALQWRDEAQSQYRRQSRRGLPPAFPPRDRGGRARLLCRHPRR